MNTKRKNTKAENANIANILLLQADWAYEDNEEAKKRFHSIKRYIEYVERFNSLCSRFTHHVGMLRVYNSDKSMAKKSIIERNNIKSLQYEIKLIIAFRPDWAERYGIDLESARILLSEYK